MKSTRKTKFADHETALLDLWAPVTAMDVPVGDPIGFLATTYTFQSDFFEEECLPRFLALESSPEDEGGLFFAEREQKLAQLACRTVIVDAAHAKGGRSFFWDLKAARPAKGIQHSKICLLMWAGLLRVTISSANLTRPGYRYNREVVNRFDFHEGASAPRELVGEVAAFLSEVLATCRQEEDEGSAEEAFLTRCVDFVSTLTLAPLDSGLTVTGAFVSPTRPSLFAQIEAHWPARVPPTMATVTSPFFDQASDNAPSAELWKLLRQRGEATTEFRVLVERQNDTTHILAPQSLLQAKPKRDATTVTFREITSEDGGAVRPLHAKIITLSTDDTILCCVGSSNFTAQGTGLFPEAIVNYEANVLHGTDEKAAFRCLDRFDLPGPEKPLDVEGCTWAAPVDAEEEEDAAHIVPLHASFGEAELLRREDHLVIVVRLTGTPPKHWHVQAGTRADLYWMEDRPGSWELGEKSLILKLPQSERPPSWLTVTWDDRTRHAFLPVIVKDRSLLTLGEAVSQVRLSDLADLLASNYSYTRIIALLQQRALEKDPRDRFMDGTIDPHKKVDVTSFIIPRTRRMTRAFTGICRRIAAPCFTKESLEWRLHGPLGAEALARAIEHAQVSEEEKAFFLAELGFELLQVSPETRLHCLERGLVETAIRECAHAILNRATHYSTKIHGTYGDYVQRLLAHCQSSSVKEAP